MSKPNLSLKIYKKVENFISDEVTNLYPQRLQDRYLDFETRLNTSISTELYENIETIKVNTRLGGVVFRDNINISVEKETWYSLECWALTNDFSTNDNNIIDGLTQRLGICVYSPYPCYSQNIPDYIINNDFGISKIGVRIEKEIEGFGFDNGIWIKLKTLIYTNQENLLKSIGIYYHDNRKKTIEKDGNANFIIENYEFYFYDFVIKKIDNKPIFERLKNDEIIEVSINPEDVTLNKSFQDLEGVNKSGSEYSKTIKIDATPDIKKFFSFFHQTNNASIARKQYKAILCIDTIPIIEGDINGFDSNFERKKNKDNEYYSLYIKEKLKSWVEELENKNMKDLKNLDFQEFSILPIKKTFDNNGNSYQVNKTGNFIYSRFCVFAYFLYGQEFINNTIDLNNLRPHFFVKALITKIFNMIGFNVEFQGFTNSDEFRDLVYVFNQEKFLLSDEKKLSGINRFVSYFPITQNKELIDTIISETPAGDGYQFKDRVRSYKVNYTSIPDVDNFRYDNENIFRGTAGQFYAISEGKYKFRMKIMVEYGFNFITNSDTLNNEIFLDFDVDMFECDYIEFFVHHFQNTSNINLVQGSSITDPDVFSCDYLRFCYRIRGGQYKYVQFKYTSLTFINLNKNKLYDYFIVSGVVTEPSLSNNGFNQHARNVLFSNPTQYFADGGYQKDRFSSVHGNPIFRFYRARVLSGSWLQAELIGEHNVTSGGNKLLKLPINNYLPDMLQLDFIKSMASIYDLFFETNEKTKTITIHIFDEYIKSLTKNKDWTNKIDEKTINKKPYSDKDYNYLLAYNEDSDDSTIQLQNQISINKYKTNYGADLVIDTNANNQQQKMTENNLFYPTAMSKIEENLYLPTSEKNETGHRLLRYLGVITPSGISSRIIYGCTGSTFETIVGYPAMTFEGLNYRTIDNIKGLRERFWQSRINLLQKSIVMEAWFWLNLIDILNIDFSMPIKIENDYWLLQKIKDFPATLDKTTKVELLRLV